MKFRTKHYDHDWLSGFSFSHHFMCYILAIQLVWCTTATDIKVEMGEKIMNEKYERKTGDFNDGCIHTYR